MDRVRALELLAQSKPVLATRYGVTVRNPELIGEAATHVPHAVRDACPQIPWRLIVATRNRLIHSYLGIDNDTLWSIIRSDIPALLPALRALKAKIV